MNKISISKLEHILQTRIESQGVVDLINIPRSHEFLNMEQAAKRVAVAIANKEKILVVGDYDVDGVTSTAILVDFFSLIKYPVDYVIPNRFKHGYGISEKVIHGTEASLIITVDNGISAVDAARWCKARGIDLIITDHHIPHGELPDAYLIVNQKQDGCTFPYYEVCGAEIAWYLTKAIETEMNITHIPKGHFFDLMGVAIIADVMPLLNMNRSLVQMALKLMGTSKRPFFKVIKEGLRDGFTSESVAFQIAPMINAAGRLEDASVALAAYLSSDDSEARTRIAELKEINEKRKSIERSIFEEASKSAENHNGFIVVYGKDWHEGVLGIVASRLVEKFRVPAIVLAEGEEGYFKGSGRSLGDVDLFKIMCSGSEFLARFGGHKLAGGMSIPFENILPFTKACEAACQKYPADAFLDKEGVVGEITLSDVSIPLVHLMTQYEPFGQGNPRPVFSMSDMYVERVHIMKEIHKKVLISKYENGTKYAFEAVMFNCSEELAPGFIIDVECTIGINSFRDQNNIQLMVGKFKVKGI